MKKSELFDGVVDGPAIAPVMSDFLIGSRFRADMGEFAPSLTRQEFAEECDINIMMERYEKSGVISHVNRAQPMYMDLTGMPDIREAMDIMRDATVAFMALPAKVRREFDNDPVKFVEFAENGENIDRMREWGLAPPLVKDPDPVVVRVLPEAPPKPSGASAAPAPKVE